MENNEGITKADLKDLITLLNFQSQSFFTVASGVRDIAAAIESQARDAKTMAGRIEAILKKLPA